MTSSNLPKGSKGGVIKVRQVQCINLLNENTDGTCDTTHNDAKHEQHVGHEIIRYNSRPTSLFKEFRRLWAGIQQAIPVQANVGQCPRIEMVR
jgi:hypothetical protein